MKLTGSILFSVKELALSDMRQVNAGWNLTEFWRRLKAEGEVTVADLRQEYTRQQSAPDTHHLPPGKAA